jgi:RNA polymerase sigma-70 factor (ECF subfamily)
VAGSNKRVAISKVLPAIWTRSEPPGWKARVTSPTVDGAPPDDLALADDAAAVRACLAGDPVAFDVVVRRHQRHVYRLCYRFVGNHEDASDLAQDVFVRAYRGLRGFKGDSAFATWLYRIAVNVCLNRVSARKTVFAPIEAADRPDPRAERADAMLLRAERVAEVRSAIARLPPKQRATLILRVYHDMPHEQIAGVLGSSVGAVKANFFHALGNLRKLLRARS